MISAYFLTNSLGDVSAREIYLLSLSENEQIKDIFSIRLKQHRKYKQIYHNIQKNKDVINNFEYKPKFACEDIMRHKPIIFMDDEKYIFENIINELKAQGRTI